jgi:hypothetical protein
LADFFELVNSPLKRKDTELRWTLVALVVAFLVEVVEGNLLGGVSLLVVLSSWVVGTLLCSLAFVGFSRHRYSQAGLILFGLPVVLFQGWAGIAFWVAIWTWSPSWPTQQLGVIQASSTLPLLVGIYLMSRGLARMS